MGLRPQRLTRFFFALFGGTLAFSPEAEVSGDSRPWVEGVVAIELTVADAARSRAFFEQLGFVFVHEAELSGQALEARSGLKGARVRRVELALGNERIALLQYLAPANGRPVPPDTRGNDLWFQHIAIVVRDMDRAYRWLRTQRVTHISSGPQKLPAWNRQVAGIQAFYFADPDGHALELIDFPQGKGAPRWQAPARCSRTPAELCQFLGIDHTAITVSDTERSLEFYRDRLGFRVAGESENYGFEQEHLNGVFGARLRITALRAASGPGIELLEYLSPRGGRPSPNDVRPNDLFHWEVVVVSHTPGSAASLRDRDGHALRVIKAARHAD